MQEDVNGYMQDLGTQAREASKAVGCVETAVKNSALINTAKAIEESRETLIGENRKDLSAGQHSGLDSALLDRLELNQQRIDAMAEALQQIAALPDPVGEISNFSYKPSGIQVGRMRVPLGVIGIIYESRPNVTADAAGLCLKAGNACILRGGSEAFHSNQAIASCIRFGLEQAGLPIECVQVVGTTDRAAVGELIRMDKYVDMIVPRGGKGLIERISREATIPVMKHLDGVCHVYIDDNADPEKAVQVAYNAKTQRYGTCNTMETLLIARSMVDEVLPELANRYQQAGVELRGCQATCETIPGCLPASEQDWYTEYLAPILSIRIVADLDAALDHISKYGSSHTDCIITEDYTRARRFLREVDSSSVMVNVSTRFADGFEYGLGAEIGISTDKLHARGPVGLEGLTTQKFVVLGDGQIRQ